MTRLGFELEETIVTVTDQFPFAVMHHEDRIQTARVCGLEGTAQPLLDRGREGVDGIIAPAIDGAIDGGAQGDVIP